MIFFKSSHSPIKQFINFSLEQVSVFWNKASNLNIPAQKLAVNYKQISVQPHGIVKVQVNK